MSTKQNVRPFGFRDKLGYLFGDFGNALLPEHHKEDMELINEIGCTTIRLAHYQHDQYFYDLCDEYGCEALNWHTSKPTQGDYTEEYQAFYHEELIRQLFTRIIMVTSTT